MCQNRVTLAGLLLVAALPAGAAPLVAVDAGHSPEQPGAISARGLPELEYNLKLAHAIAAELEQSGVAVRSIGADGPAGSLRDRAARAAGTRLLLSVHHDSVQPRYLERWRYRGRELAYSDRYSGYSLFISGRNPQEARSLDCAASIGRSLRSSGFRPARHHGEAIEGEARRWADYSAGVHYFDDLVVLRTAEVPAVLLEAGVILNRKEEMLLGQERYRRRLARAVAQGIRKCLASDKPAANALQVLQYAPDRPTSLVSTAP